MASTVLIILAASLSFLTVLLLFAGWQASSLTDNQKQIQGQLRRLVVASREVVEDQEILRDVRLSAIGLLDQLLTRVQVARSLELLLYKAGMEMRVGTFVLISAVAGCGTALLVIVVLKSLLHAVVLGLLAVLVPYLVVQRKKNSRMREIEEQLPDALDLMTGALRAGLSLPAAMQLQAQEGPEPLADEFGYTFEEQNLGIDVKNALLNMAERIDGLDIKFFAIAVIIQRESGGNLTEILEKLAFIVRERFRILGDVRSMTAHGRLTGVALSALPVAMGIILTVLAPDYMLNFFQNPAGQKLLLAALVLQLLGFVWIRKVVSIKI